MATCERCIHFEVCEGGKGIDAYIDDGKYTNGVEKECPMFTYEDGRKPVKDLDDLSDAEIVKIAKNCNSTKKCTQCRMYHEICDEDFLDVLSRRVVALAEKYVTIVTAVLRTEVGEGQESRQ